MTILTLNRKKFEKDVGKLDEKLQEKIALFGTPVEGLTDDELQIEIFPNRSDLLSYGNYVSAFKVYLGCGTKGKIKLNKPEKNFKVNVDKSVKGVRPYTVCCVVKNLKLDDEKIKEIIDVQEKLHLTLGRKRKKAAIGIYPLEKISLPITYRAMKPEEIRFRPLEFPNEVNARQILSKHSAGRDYGKLLEGFEKFPIFVDADDKVLSMPPIINSHDTGKVSLETRDVFIECSGCELETLNKIMNILVTTFDSLGGRIYQMSVGGKTTPDFISEKMKLSLERVNKFLGLSLKESEVKKYLERMGYDYVKGNVFVPSYRVDVLHEVDLIEDIAIAYGYDNFEPEIPEISTIGEIDPRETLKRKIAEVFSGKGMVETMSYHLVSKDTIKRFSGNGKDFIQVKGSKTENEFLRKDLSSYLMKIFSENVDVEYPQEIFQLGRVFTGDGYEERERLAIGITPGNFTKLKQVLDYFSRMFDLDLTVKEVEEVPSHFISGRVASVTLDDKVIGFIGEVHPRVIGNFKLKMPVALFEIEIDEILGK
tara:strand:- start:4730 stop:6340 length:1611 start_codon:yes stop_codon:yes gene_type:complete